MSNINDRFVVVFKRSKDIDIEYFLLDDGTNVNFTKEPEQRKIKYFYSKSMATVMMNECKSKNERFWWYTKKIKI